MMGFVQRPDAEICVQRRVGIAEGRGDQRRRGRSRSMRSFKTLRASRDKRTVGGEWHEVRLVREECCVGVADNQE